MNILILYSGGLDSFILYHYAKKQYPDAEVQAVYYRHGQPAMQKELDRLPSWVIQKEMEWLDEHNGPVAMKTKPTEGAIFIPGRNMAFITLAACQFTPDEIWMGSVANEVTAASTDKNQLFVDKMNDILNYVLDPFLENGIKVRIPFVEDGMGKIEAVRWALDHGITKEEILNTPSCYGEDDISCGVCIQCLRRWAIFGLIGMNEEYAKDPVHSHMMVRTLTNMVKGRPQSAFYYDEILKNMKIYLTDNPGTYGKQFEDKVLGIPL